MIFRVLALLAGLVLIPGLAFSQEAIPPYQSPIQREICIAGPVFDRPGGDAVGEVARGQMITLLDIAFDAEGKVYLAYEDGDELRAIPADRTAHFCDYASRAEAVPAPYLAPPNTCHLIAASRRTLDEVSAFVQDHAEYLPSTYVFRAQNGWYAISLGLVSTKAAADVLAEGRNIPDDAYCSDGANYFEVAVFRDGRFVDLDPPGPADVTERRDEAINLSVERNDEDSAERLLRSCYLGNGRGCGLYASLIGEGQEDRSEALWQEMTRFNLLACMQGEAVACHNADTEQYTILNHTLLTALPDLEAEAQIPLLIDYDMRKIGCDAGVGLSCTFLAQPVLSYHQTDPADYLTAFEADLKSCDLLKGWHCRELDKTVEYITEDLGVRLSPVSDLALARRFEPLCKTETTEYRTECDAAYRHYNSFLAADFGDAGQRADAALVLRNGCESGSARACVYETGLPDVLELADRQLAATKAKEICEGQEYREKVCDDLLKVMAPDLPEAQHLTRAKYEEFAEKCRSEEGDDGSNPCRSAMWYYGGNISQDDIDEPLTLLKENCNDNGKITGCRPLYDFYSGHEISFANNISKAWPEQPEKAREAIKKGCVATLEGVSNCGSIGNDYEQDGDFAEAGRYYEIGCNTGMTAGQDEYFGQGRICYWAAKNARDNLQDYENARKWFGYTCYNEEDPFACKFLGLMYAQAEGGEADPLRALDLYERGCNVIEDITTGDGQSCLFLGQSLVSMHDKVVADGEYRIATDGDEPADALSQYNLTTASRAFLRACMDDVTEACKAHSDLLQAWSKGDYPSSEVDCRVMDAAGQMEPAKICGRFFFYLAPPEGLADAAPAHVFVWPDGDRTVVFEDGGTMSLNGVAGTLILPEGGWECVKNPATGRSFCY